MISKNRFNVVLGLIALILIAIFGYNYYLSQGSVAAKSIASIPVINETAPENTTKELPSNAESVPSTTTTMEPDGGSTTTILAPDGSVNITNVAPDGGSTVTTTTTPNGITSQTNTAPDGSSSTTTTAPDGTSNTIKSSPDGNSTTSTTLITDTIID